MLKVIILLLVTIIVTYFAKFHTYSVEPVREHENLGWFLPLHHSLSFLFVSADDNNDTNYVKTGYRVWFNPPQEPDMLTIGEKAVFVGPGITVIGDSLELHTIAQIAKLVTDGGLLHIIGRQIIPTDLIKKINTHIHISLDTLINQTISLPMGSDIVNTFEFDSLGQYTANISSRHYSYLISNKNSVTLIDSSTYSIVALLNVPPQRPHDEILNITQTAIFRNISDSSGNDSTLLNLFEKDKAVVFYEDKSMGENRVLIKKIHLAHWIADGQ